MGYRSRIAARCVESRNDATYAAIDCDCPGHRSIDGFVVRLRHATIDVGHRLFSDHCLCIASVFLAPIYLSAFGSLVGYLVFLGYARFVLQASIEDRVPRTNQIIFGIALIVAGLLAGQSVRQARRIANRSFVRVVPVNGEQQ